MFNGYSLNVPAFIYKQVSRIANSTTRGIVIGGLITPIVEHVDVSFCEDIEFPLTGRSWCNLESLLNMGMINRDGELYGLMVHVKAEFYLSNRKTRIRAKRNWLYNVGNPSGEESRDEGFPSFETNHAGCDMDGNEAQVPLPIRKPRNLVNIKINGDICTHKLSI